MDKKVTLTIFGRKVTVTFSEDDLEAMAATPAELRAEAKQWILNTLIGVSESEPYALVRVTEIQ